MALVDPKLTETFRQLALGKLPWPLYLWGNAGRGKTRAVLAFCDFAKTASYWTVDGLCDLTMANPPATVQAEWDRIGGKDLAVLDELGCRQNVTDLHYSTAKRFTDTRELQAGNVAIYVSNLDPVSLAAAYDDRIGSRILGGTIFELKDTDRRYHQ